MAPLLAALLGWPVVLGRAWPRTVVSAVAALPGASLRPLCLFGARARAVATPSRLPRKHSSAVLAATLTCCTLGWDRAPVSRSRDLTTARTGRDNDRRTGTRGVGGVHNSSGDENDRSDTECAASRFLLRRYSLATRRIAIQSLWFGHQRRMTLESVEHHIGRFSSQEWMLSGFRLPRARQSADEMNDFSFSPSFASKAKDQDPSESVGGGIVGGRRSAAQSRRRTGRARAERASPPD